MKKLGNHNRHRQWTQHEKEEEPEVKVAKRVFAGAKQSPRTLRTWWGKSREWGFSLSKGKAVLLLVLLGIGLLVSVDQYLRVTEVQASIYGGETKQPLWVGSNDLNGWNCRLATAPTSNRIRLDSNTTHTSWCITKAPIDLSPASGKTLGIGLSWFLVSNPGTYPSELGWFLTRNATARTEAVDYSPEDDVNVALLLRHVDGGAGAEGGVAFLQRSASLPLRDGDLTGCVAGGTPFLCYTGNLPDNTSEASYSELRLNYTGNVGSAGARSYLWVGETALPPPLGATTNILPWFQFQFQQYYVGFYVRPRTPDPVAIEWYLPTLASDPDGHIFYGTSQYASAAAPSQNIDTGGYFGPVFRGLFEILVPAGTVVYDAFRGVAETGVNFASSVAAGLGLALSLFAEGAESLLNGIGSVFGLGTLGTSVVSFFTGISSFIANVFGTVIGWLGTISSLFQNSIAFVTNFFSGSNGFVAWLVSFFSTLPGIWAVIQDLWTGLGSVVLGMNFILVIYYLMGMFQVYKNGWPGFRDWAEMGALFTVKIFQVGFIVAKEAWGVLVTIKALVTSWV